MRYLKKALEWLPRLWRWAPKAAAWFFHLKKWIPVTVLSVLGVLILSGLLLWINGARIEFSIPADETVAVECGTGYQTPQVTAVLRGRLLFRAGKELRVTEKGTVDPDRPGEYEQSWSAGFLGFTARRVRKVKVADTTPPVITLVPETREYILPGTQYEDPGYSAADTVDGDLTAQIQRTEKDETVIYTVTDRAGNTARVTRKIPYNDPVPPEIILSGNQTVYLTVGKGAYEEPGYKATDNLDGDITARVTVSGKVDPDTPGSYVLTYAVEDTYHNKTEVKRTVIVQSPRRTAPQPDYSGSDAPSDKVIYLTFDDGPGPYTGKLLDILAKYNVKVTFFVTGNGNTDLIAREAAEGHTVAIHSLTHNYEKIYASEDAFFADLWAMNEIIKQKTGSYSSLLRFPGGSSNTVSRFNRGIMSRLTDAVEEAGFVYFDWNVSSGDAGETTSTARVVQNVINGVRGRRYSVVLQHDIKNFSVNAVEEIIQWGLENGYTFLPLNANSPTAHHGVNN